MISNKENRDKETVTWNRLDSSSVVHSSSESEVSLKLTKSRAVDTTKLNEQTFMKSKKKSETNPLNISPAFSQLKSRNK